jgi:hypothetical protein
VVQFLGISWKAKIHMSVKVKAILFFLTFYICNTISVNSQETDSLKRYTSDFKFKDGIFLNFEQVKNNNPISKAKLLTSADYNDRDFFNKVLESGKIYFYDEIGVRQEIDKSNLWGYARNGVLYIQVQETFNRITFVGSISHFVADVTTYDSRYNGYSPYGYYDPYYSPYYSPYSYGSYSPYGSYYSPYRQSVSRNELKQYIFDFETGKVVEFTPGNVAILLMKDPSIYDEYIQLSNKKKKELMFVYIRKFNEKNPLYLPVK